MPACNAPVSSEDYADFIYHYGVRTTEEVFEIAGTRCVDFVNREYAIIYVPLSEAEPISLNRFTYAAIPKLYGLQDTTALESSGIIQSFDQPVINADGHGVIIGIIDTGIEYTNPLFRGTDGSTRILGIWDQTIDSGQENIPNGDLRSQPLYGTFYTKEQIDLALISENPYEIVPSRDTDGHGTFMAGVAAGNRILQPVSFSGAAPESSLVVVKLKPAKQYLREFFLLTPGTPAFQENDIMMGIRYLFDQATKFDMPLVIYLGVGTSQGNHDGTAPLGSQLQQFTGNIGLSAVVGAGNEVGYHHHFLGDMTAGQKFEDVELRVGEGENGFCMELWAREPELYTVGFVSPAGEVIERIPMRLGGDITIPFRLERTVITVNYRSAEVGTGSQLIFMRFVDPTPGIWHIRVYPSLDINGQFHIWLPMHGFISDQTIFLRPNPDTTITDPGNAPMPLTVSTYDHVTGSIYVHSSRGYTRHGIIKPDFAAPGVNVQGPALSTPDEELRFTRATGSSVAAAIAAGAAAGVLSWGIIDGNEPNLDDTTVNAILIRGADRNPALVYPSREWGYGTLNLYQSFLRTRE